MAGNAFLNMLTGYKKTCALLAGLEIGIFDKIREPATLGELAESCGADEPTLKCLLQYFEAEGLARNRSRRE